MESTSGFKSPTERQIWVEVFLSFRKQGAGQLYAVEQADESLEAYRQRNNVTLNEEKS